MASNYSYPLLPPGFGYSQNTSVADGTSIGVLNEEDTALTPTVPSSHAMQAVPAVPAVPAEPAEPGRPFDSYDSYEATSESSEAKRRVIGRVDFEKCICELLPKASKSQCVTEASRLFERAAKERYVSKTVDGPCCNLFVLDRDGFTQTLSMLAAKGEEELGEEEQYKNPRNLCSGTVRQLNSEIAAKRNVKFIAFTLVSAEGITLSDSKAENMAWLAEMGFDVVEHCMVTAETVAAAVEEFRDKIEQNDIASDGLVLTFDSIAYSQSLGRTAKFPKDSIAFKWADEMAETTLRRIEWNTSRTGLMNPVAVFDPVELEGSTVSRASLHNVSILKELKLSIGDTIKVYKANMIIPQIAENLTGTVSTAEIPKHCFVCGEETEIRKLRDGEALYCTNPNCSAQRIQALSHFVSRDAMNIEGLSEETLKKFLEKGFVENYPDLFRLEKHQAEITAMEGFGEKSYQNLIASVEKAKSAELPNFIYALGINHVGLRNAKLLCREFDYDLEKIKAATEDALVQVEGFGEIIAHSIAYYFRQEAHLALLADVLQYLSFQAAEQAEVGESPLAGLTFVVTGDLEQFANRKELQALIEKGGGKVTGSVTKRTNFLINNDIHSASSKNKKAAELGIPILSEQDFIDKFLK